jgi:hypothetical protein
MPVLRVVRVGGDTATGESELELNVSNAGRSPEVLVATTQGDLPTGQIITDRIYRTKEVELWFQARKPETGELSEPVRWTGSIDITHDRQDVAGVWRVSLTTRPEAKIRWNITGINSKEGTIYDGGQIEIDGQAKTTLYVYASKGSVSAEKRFALDAIGAKREIKDDLPARVERDFQFPTKGEVIRMIRATKTTPEIAFQGVNLIVGSGENNLRVRSGADVALSGKEIETMIEGLRGALGDPDAEIQLRCLKADFPDGYRLKDFATQLGIDIPAEDVEQTE